RDDRYDVGGWELVVHRLAKRAGVWVPESHAAAITDRHHTFCVARFDRDREGRRMFASAMTLLEGHAGDRDSYLELAQFIADLEAVRRTAELYRLKPAAADRVLDEVRDAVATWVAEAARLGLPALEIHQMRSVYTPAR